MGGYAFPPGQFNRNPRLVPETGHEMPEIVQARDWRERDGPALSE
jgi:hypothetical protein